MCRLYPFICLLMLNMGNIFSQRSTSSIFQNIIFENYSMEDGLPANYIYRVVQDKRGYVWVATLNGLSRFNGKQWTSFQQQSEKKNHSLPSNWVTDIDADEVGNIWINTVNGIAVYNSKTDSTIAFSLDEIGWGKIVHAKENELYVSSWQGIQQLIYKEGVLTSIKKFPSSKGNSITQLFADADGNIWACPEDNPSLMKIDSKTKELNHIKKIKYHDTLTEMVVYSIAQYEKDTLLLCSRKLGLLKYHPATNEAFEIFNDHGPKPLDVTCSMIYEYNGNKAIVIGTKGAGLYVHLLHTNTTYVYQHNIYNPSGIPSNFVLSIYKDNNDGLWISTSKGLSYFHPLLQQNKYYHFYSNTDDAGSFLINCVAQISNESFLVGTDDNGLLLYKTVNDTKPMNVLQEPIKKISSFCWLDTNHILVSTNAGLYKFDVNTKICSNYIIKGISGATSVLKVKKLNSDILAICTNDGLVAYNYKTANTLYSELGNGIPRNEKICKDAFMYGKDLWILRFFRGLDVYSFQTKSTIHKTPTSLLNKSIDYHNLTYDNKGHLFVSSSSGLIVQNIYTKEEAQVYNTANGLAGDIIENVLYTDNGLYYTTREALYNIQLNTFTSTRVHQYNNYPQKWHNQLEMLPDSNIVYTISDHFIIYEAPKRAEKQLLPKCEIEEITINGKRRNISTDALYLNYRENNISIQLAGLVYPSAERTSWIYYLDNEKNIHATNDGKIELNYLAPGDYQLVITSKNYEGLVSPNKKILIIHIKAPYYKTWWFYTLVAMSIVLLIGLFFEYRRRQQKNLIEIRNQISRDLHDELGANVSSINIMSNMLLRDKNEKNRNVIENISKYSIQISDTINDIIWNINPRFDTLDELIKKMTRYASETLDATEINYSFITPNPLPKIAIRNKHKYHLYLIFKEVINNAAKYSNAKNIDIAIDYTDKKFGFTVSDNGVGFDETAHNKGNGLRNMSVRAKELKAKLNIVSALDKGTKVDLNVKIS